MLSKGLRLHSTHTRSYGRGSSSTSHYDLSILGSSCSAAPTWPEASRAQHEFPLALSAVWTRRLDSICGHVVHSFRFEGGLRASLPCPSKALLLTGIYPGGPCSGVSCRSSTTTPAARRKSPRKQREEQHLSQLCTTL